MPPTNSGFMGRGRNVRRGRRMAADSLPNTWTRELARPALELPTLVRALVRLHVWRQLPHYRHLIRGVEEELASMPPPAIHHRQLESPVTSPSPSPERDLPPHGPSHLAIGPEHVEELCVICASRPNAVRLSCGHLFCGHCPSHWQASRGGRLTCPMCRTLVHNQVCLSSANPDQILPLDNNNRPPGMVSAVLYNPDQYINPRAGSIECGQCGAIIRDTLHRRHRHSLSCIANHD